VADSDKEIDVAVKATTKDLAPGLADAQAQVAKSVAYIRESIGGLGTVVERIKIPFLELAGIMAGGAAFKEFIEKTQELGVSLLKASQQTGLTVEQLGGLKFAAEQSDVSFQTLTKGLEKLSLGMQTSVQTPSATTKLALEQLGISATDAEGRLRPAGEVMLEVADKFHDMEDGSGKTAIAMQIFGRSGAEMIPVLNLGSAAMKQLSSDATDMGAVMTKDGAEKAEVFHEAMGHVGLVGQAVGIAISSALMPALSNLANAFADSAKDGGLLNAAITVMKGAIEAVSIAFIGLQTGISIVWAIGEAMAVSLAELFVQVGVAVKDAMRGNFTGAADDLKQLTTDVQSNVDKMVNDIVTSSTAAGDALKKTLGLGADNTPEGPKTAAPPVIGSPQSMMPKFNEQWLEIKEKQGAFATDLLQMERDFWAAKLEEVNKGSKDYLAIHSKVVDLTFQLQKQQYKDQVDALKNEETEAQGHSDEMVAIKQRELDLVLTKYAAWTPEALAAARELDKAQEQAAKDAVARQDTLLDMAHDHETSLNSLAIQGIEFRRQMGEISDAQALAEERKYIEASYQLDRKRLTDKRDSVAQDSQAYADYTKQIAALDDSHNSAMIANANSTALAIKSQWDSVFSTITSAVQTSFNGVIQGMQTFQQAWAGLARSIALEFASMEAKRLASHVAAELGMTQATASGTASRLAMETWAHIQSVAMTMWRGIANIATYAAEAVAATYASVAAIPIVGPFLAPAMAIAIGAAVLGEIGHIASAAGGYDIPSGVNPMTQLHAREMVLPATLADAVRGMAAGGGSGAGGGGDTYHLHVTAMDGQSVERVLRSNPAAVAAGVKAAVRGGHLQGGAAT